MREKNVWMAERENAGAAAEAPGKTWGRFVETLAGYWRQVRIRRKPHTLRLEETLALGEKRLLAIVEWKGEKLLLGVTPQRITLLETQGRTANSREEAVQQ